MLFTLRGQKETAHTTTMNMNVNMNTNVNMNISMWMWTCTPLSISRSKTLMTNSNRPKRARGGGKENAEGTTANVFNKSIVTLFSQYCSYCGLSVPSISDLVFRLPPSPYFLLLLLAPLNHFPLEY